MKKVLILSLLFIMSSIALAMEPQQPPEEYKLSKVFNKKETNDYLEAQSNVTYYPQGMQTKAIYSDGFFIVKVGDANPLVFKVPDPRKDYDLLPFIISSGMNGPFQFAYPDGEKLMIHSNDTGVEKIE